MSSPPIIICDDDPGCSIDQLAIPKHYVQFIDHVMISEGFVNDRVRKLAHEIHEDYQGKSIIAVSILKGAEKVFAQLTDTLHSLNETYGPNMSVPVDHDQIKATSYTDNKSSGKPKYMFSEGQLESYTGKHVIIIEDIIDTGATMDGLVKKILEYNPASLRVLSLLIKRLPTPAKFKPDYAGFSIPDHFVVGYMLDFNQKLRDISHICVLNSQGIEYFKKN